MCFVCCVGKILGVFDSWQNSKLQMSNSAKYDVTASTHLLMLLEVLLLQLADADDVTTDACENQAADFFSTLFPLIVGWLPSISWPEVSVRFLLAAVVVLLTAVLVITRLCRLLLKPIDRVKLLGDVGYIVDGRQSMNDVAEQFKRRRVVGDVPPVYPNGWFALIESRCLKVGQVNNVCSLGKTSSRLLQDGYEVLLSL